MKVLACLIIVFSISGQAAVDKKSLSKTFSALKMPLDKGLPVLVGQGQEGYRNLVRLAFDSKRDMRVRWRSLNRLARIGQERSLPELERAAKSEEWFMRGAALVAMQEVVPGKAQVWAQKLVKDPALVVRSSAVDILKMFPSNHAEIFWSQLKDRKNFHKGRSLWIRRKLVEALVLQAEKKDTARFIELLEDRDKTLHEPAIAALEKIHGQQLGKVEEPTEYRATYWRDWWQKKAL